jgi:hypothetical protein
MQAQTVSAFDGLGSPCREALRKAGIDPSAAATAAASIVFHSTTTDGGLLVSNGKHSATIPAQLIGLCIFHGETNRCASRRILF